MTKNLMNPSSDYGLPTHDSANIELSMIGPRVNGDTRPLNVAHVFKLAHSIESCGLIASIAVDRDYHLIAGGHRLMALRLLNPETRSAAIQQLIYQERSHRGTAGADKSLRLIDELRESLPSTTQFDFEHVPVNVYELSSAEYPDHTFSIEVAENTLREDYSPQEVYELYQVLLAKGFSDPIGRPRKGEKPVKPAIASIIGKSLRTVHRKLEQAQAEAKKTTNEKLRDQALKVIKSAKKLGNQLTQLEPEVAESVKSSIEWSTVREDLLSAIDLIDNKQGGVKVTKSP